MRFAYINGEDTAKRRKRILELFRQRKVDVIIGNKILDEGIDLPLMETLILASGGKAEHRQIQRIGRVMRTHEGKERATVFDMADEGWYLKKHSDGRALAYEMEPAFNVKYISDSEFWEIFGDDSASTNRR